MNKSVNGTMIYYYFVCKRKLWYFCHGICLEQDNENVQIGKILDETSYSRDEKHIIIDNVINIDFIRSRNTLHEIKKSKKIEEAGIWQLKFYLYYLKKRGTVKLNGKIDYPLLKQSINVTLSNEDEATLDRIIEDIHTITNHDLPEVLEKTSICKSCAYFDICFI